MSYELMLCVFKRRFTIVPDFQYEDNGTAMEDKTVMGSVN